MFLKLTGYFSIACGILWLVKPEWLRGWVTWSAGGKLFWLAMGIVFLPLFHFGAKAGFAGILGIIIVIWLGRKMIQHTLKHALGKVPLQAFQAVALMSVISGVVMVWPGN